MYYTRFQLKNSTWSDAIECFLKLPGSSGYLARDGSNVTAPPKEEAYASYEAGNDMVRDRVTERLKDRVGEEVEPLLDYSVSLNRQHPINTRSPCSVLLGVYVGWSDPEIHWKRPAKISMQASHSFKCATSSSAMISSQ